MGNYQADASLWAAKVDERITKVEFGVDGAAAELRGVWQDIGARHFEASRGRQSQGAAAAGAVCTSSRTSKICEIARTTSRT